MKATQRLKTFLLALLFTTVLAGNAVAALVTVDLVAEQVNVTMPDAVVVPMWKFRQAADPAGSPPPVISATVGDALTINLTNNLVQEPVSLVINGQQATESGAMVPVWLDGSFGNRSSTAQRVRSFTHEAALNGGTASYEWGNLRAGTYLIQSGTHPSVQMPMGLYAVLKVVAAPNQAYGPASAFDGEAVLLFSEVSSALNNAVVSGTYGTPTYPTALAMKYEPDYFLINGAPFPGSSPIAAGTADAVNPTVLRFLNAGSRERSAVIHGRYATPLATDGNLRTDLAPQYSVDLAPGGTIDLLMPAPASAGFVKISERTLGLAGGGMLAYLAYAPATPGVTYTLNVTTSGNGTGVVTVGAPGGINCGTDCSEIYDENTVVTLTATALPGSLFAGWSGGCTGSATCDVTMTVDTIVNANFMTTAARIGVYRNGNWYLDINGNWSWNQGIDLITAKFIDGAAGDIPVTGDWDNNGVTDVGVYRNGIWYLDMNGNRVLDQGVDLITTSKFGGVTGDIPVTGDWDGDGITDIGVYRNGIWYLDMNGNRVWNQGVDLITTSKFGGVTGDIPVTGNW
jgi:FtsP/CotA-like multicopper oxidase with cupredoxin domain